MYKYEYQIIRYKHDQFTGEFVNVGIVVYNYELNFLKTKIINKLNRLSGLFNGANIRFIKKMLHNFEHELNLTSKQLNSLFTNSIELDKITNKILPNDDSALQLSELKYSIDLDMDSALNGLFSDLVDKYNIYQNLDSINDEKVWKLKYKKYFDKFSISEQLTKCEIKTEDDVFSFNKAWRNDIWHCYQPLSFNLQNIDRIKDKVYKWVGKMQEIQSSVEPVHISFLTSISKEHSDTEDFIIKLLTTQQKKLTTEVISENEAELLAIQISKMMHEHDNTVN